MSNVVRAVPKDVHPGDSVALVIDDQPVLKRVLTVEKKTSQRPVYRFGRQETTAWYEIVFEEGLVRRWYPGQTIYIARGEL
jgi:hypothetical protein